jgi:hypothetical protein
MWRRDRTSAGQKKRADYVIRVIHRLRIPSMLDRTLIAMIENLDTARRVNDLLLEISGKLDESVALVQSTCSETTFISYRSAIGKVMGRIFFEVFDPLYKAHPNLKPPEFG